MAVTSFPIAIKSVTIDLRPPAVATWQLTSSSLSYAMTLSHCHYGSAFSWKDCDELSQFIVQTCWPKSCLNAYWKYEISTKIIISARGLASSALTESDPVKMFRFSVPLHHGSVATIKRDDNKHCGLIVLCVTSHHRLFVDRIIRNTLTTFGFVTARGKTKSLQIILYLCMANTATMLWDFICDETAFWYGAFQNNCYMCYWEIAVK